MEGYYISNSTFFHTSDVARNETARANGCCCKHLRHVYLLPPSTLTRRQGSPHAHKARSSLSFKDNHVLL
ncbi:hypothetical protein M422DRAFT_31116 [Sphaerobolus stellatus SS14]|uniref:Uncharacterized protein n=1 Tax=Sphaerobolus stellatus (strain SS14) TaxID=990650 RepID=A0A0C9VXB4_SPHS4|nr:hypothetical protein M422DRAFT_31116 [Sphaerobolus stellatus SS14]